MTGSFFLDWAIMTVSLINVVLQLWLGLTVLLNAERRSWGVWLGAGGLLLGAAFFISHTAILGFGLNYLSSSLDIWWRLGWIPVIALPFVWYMIMLWYAGLWQSGRDSWWPAKQQGWLVLTFALLIGLIGWLIIATPIPTFKQVILLQLSSVPAIGGIPIFLIIYPLYILLCIGLALNTLRHPGSSDRIMADEARRRARPWLVTTTVVLFVVSLLVAVIIVWVLFTAQQGLALSRDPSLSMAVAWGDLFISSLIATAVIAIGQAVVSYEVFTGKALPRGGLQRYWRNAIILAMSYSVVIGGSFSLQVRPIYSLLLTTLLMVLFYALLSWRSFAWRERYMRNLRPFVTSQHLYEQLLAPTHPAIVQVDTTFTTLCVDVLGTKQAYLVALGPLAPLMQPLSYPQDTPPNPATLPALVGRFQSPQTIVLPLSPVQNNGFQWAISLWSERGLIGLFLLGPKRDNGLYTQEEIEIAQASGERLIDSRASAEIAHRLMALQRQRLAESQILDQHTRRVLHDDILPDLHATLLTLSGQPTQDVIPQTISTLTDVHGQISELLHQMPKPTVPTLNRLGLVGSLQQIISHELPHSFNKVVWHVDPQTETLTRQYPPLTTEVLFYACREAMRNAARHAQNPESPQPLNLAVTVALQNGLIISIEDDGVGVVAANVSQGGSGQGLALHSTMLAIMGGQLTIDSELDKYTKVTISLPQGRVSV